MFLRDSLSMGPAGSSVTYRPPLDPLIDFAQGDAQVLADLEQLVGHGTAPPVSVDITTPAEHTTPGLSEFVKGVELLRKGRRVEALESWRTAAALEPDNLVWRNHLWRALNPDRFDLGNLDLDWQERQLAREEEFGIVAANPMPAEKAERTFVSEYRQGFPSDPCPTAPGVGATAAIAGALFLRFRLSLCAI